VLGSKLCGEAENVIPRGRRDENLDLHKIGGSPGAAVFLNTLAD
jgi:hypothetical protein